MKSPLLAAALALLAGLVGAGETTLDGALSGATAGVKRLDAARESLSQGRYAESRHTEVAKTLAELPSQVKAIAGASEEASPARLEALRRFNEAAADAVQQEALFWSGLAPEQRRAETKIPAQAAQRLSRPLQAVSAAFLDLFPQPPLAARGPAVVSQPSAGQTVSSIEEAGASDPARAPGFWDRSRAAGEAEGPVVKAAVVGSGPRSGAGAEPAKGPGLVIKPIPNKGQGEPDPGEVLPAGAACRQVLSAHPSIAGMCEQHPTLAPLLAGLLDAIQEQFGTIKGLAMTFAFMLLGLVLSVLSGFGLVAKIAVSLVSLGFLVWTLGPLIKEGASAVAGWLGSKAGSVKSSHSLLRIGKVGGSVLIMALMAALGWGIGKTKPGKAAFSSINSAVAGKLTSIGVAGKVAALDSKIPPSLKAKLDPPPPPPAAPAPAGDLVSGLAAAAKPTAGAAAGAEAFRSMVLKVNQAIKNPSSEALRSSRSAYKSGNAAQITRLQEQFKSQLLAKSQQVAQAKGLKPDEVITHGTSLEGLMGMLMEGKIIATNRHRGMSGESANLWGAYGLKTGAQYGSTTGLAKGQPGVSILIHNKANPIKVVQGETLSRAPSVGDDFVAAVITDGSKVAVLDQAALRALAASAKAWKETAVGQAHKGNMKPFSEWEAVRDRFVPQ